MCPGQLKGCQRGLFGIKSWAPLPLPSTWQTRNGSSTQNTHNVQSAASPPDQRQPTVDTKKRMVAKYSYKVNPSSPLGKELVVSQTEKLWFLAEHPDNSHWWLAENDHGEQGYVPKSYMMILEDKAGGLPWCQQKESTATNGTSRQPMVTAFGVPAQTKVAVKPYKSSYQHPDLKQVSKEPEFYCKICEKELNGPKPYQAHMMSKAHREMVEYLGGES